MQEKGDHVLVDIEDNEMTGNRDTVVEDIRLRRNKNRHSITWAEFQEKACSIIELWHLPKALTFAAILWSHDFIIEYWMWAKFRVAKDIVKNLCGLLIMLYMPVVVLLAARYRGMPYRMVGRFGRGAVDLITLGSAMIVRSCFPDHGMYHASQGHFLVSGPLQVLLLVTLHIHCWGQTLHLLSDVGKRDIMLGAVMQVLIYVSSRSVHIYLAIFFCFVIFYRICSYKVPITLDQVKKDLVPCPCPLNLES